MGKIAELSFWIQRGRQKRAIAQVLLTPMTSTEICRAARPLNPHIQLRDIWFVLGQFKRRGLVQCLNPGQVNGKLHCLTDLGRKVVKRAFALVVAPVPEEVPWKKHALVLRARTRRAVVLELAKSFYTQPDQATAARIRKRLTQVYPIGLNPLRRALKELVQLGVVECTAATKGRKTYRLSTDGQCIHGMLSDSKPDSDRQSLALSGVEDSWISSTG